LRAETQPRRHPPQRPDRLSRPRNPRSDREPWPDESQRWSGSRCSPHAPQPRTSAGKSPPWPASSPTDHERGTPRQKYPDRPVLSRFRGVEDRRPRSRATADTDLPCSRTSRTAFALNSPVKLRRGRRGFFVFDSWSMRETVSAFRSVSVEPDQAQPLVMPSTVIESRPPPLLNGGAF
jgi:hypothetical protein